MIEKWNKLIKDKSVTLIDVRKPFEHKVGTFEGALNPRINSFREFPKYFNKLKKSNKVAMFCTGGIRCEKATSYLLKAGFQNVHHLQGGILKYLEEVPRKESLWEGECFVFDKRVALNHKLLPGVHRLCHACGMPLTPDERQDAKWKESYGQIYLKVQKLFSF